MKLIKTVKEEIGKSSYPGRGIIIGMSENGQKAVTAYFIMGRSENSRNRIFISVDDGIRTEAFDSDKLEDPSLIIYAPVRVLGNHTIVTNGDQTDTIYELMKSGNSFEEALFTREFEPDAPNYTPRISGIITIDGAGFNYKLSILKSADGDPGCCERFFYTYETPIPGKGHFIHTYEGDGDPLPSFHGEPLALEIPDDIDRFADMCWDGLDQDNKVSLFVRYIDLKTGDTESRIINKNTK